MDESYTVQLGLSWVREGALYAVDGNRTSVSLVNTGEDIHEGGFAGPIFAHQGVNLALLEGNTYIAQHLIRTKCLCNA